MRKKVANSKSNYAVHKVVKAQKRRKILFLQYDEKDNLGIKINLVERNVLDQKTRHNTSNRL